MLEAVPLRAALRVHLNLVVQGILIVSGDDCVFQRPALEVGELEGVEGPVKLDVPPGLDLLAGLLDDRRSQQVQGLQAPQSVLIQTQRQVPVSRVANTLLTSYLVRFPVPVVETPQAALRASLDSRKVVKGGEFVLHVENGRGRCSGEYEDDGRRESERERREIWKY